MMHLFPRFGSFRGDNLAGLMGFALVMAFAGAESAQSAGKTPEIGIWVNHEGKGAVEIKQCGAALCGNIVWLREPLNDQGQPLFDRRNPDESKRTRPICGLPVIGNVKRTAEGWDEGWIYNPEEGAQFDVALKAAGDRLVVTGYKGIKLFSKTLTWTRAPADLPLCNGGSPQTKAKPPVPKADAAAVAKPAKAAPGKEPGAKSTASAAPGAAKAKATAPGATPAKSTTTDKAAPAKQAKTAPAPVTAKKPLTTTAKAPADKATAAGKTPATTKAAGDKAAVPAKKTAAKPDAKKKTAEEASSAVDE